MNPVIAFLASFAFFAAATSAHAATLADCATSDGVTAGAYIFPDGKELVLQVATPTTSMDAYRTNAGAVTQTPIDLAEIQSLLDQGFTVPILFTRPSSVEAGGVITEAALVNVSVHATASSTANTSLARRSEVLSLSCVHLATP